MGVICVLALIAIAFGIYSDAALTSSKIGPAAPDPVALGIGHSLKGS